MKALVVIANPNPGSFNYALLDRVVGAFRARADEVRVLDLYQMGFPPVLSALELEALRRGEVSDEIREQQANIRWADTLVFVYALWWFDRPAILKGWCDRVLTQGFAFRYTENGVAGLLGDKRAVVLVTAGGSEDEFGEMGVSERDLLLPMALGTLRYCGVRNVVSRVFFAVPTESDAVRSRFLDDAADMIHRLPLDNARA